ncbi:MAG: glutamate synthase large subunit [Rhodospirillales bacterium]
MKAETRMTPRNELQARGRLLRQQAEALRLGAQGLYDPREEHDACGVGMVASLDKEPRREVVVAAIQSLKAVWHRGAVDADGKTGDGAGLHVQIPQDFFREHVEGTGHPAGEADIGVGMVFLPRTDFAAQERCRTIVEREIINGGFGIFGWRQVPIDTRIIGDKANAARPEIEQIMIDNRAPLDPADFERALYVIRRRIEKAVSEATIKDFYICSLSGRSIIYKGMFLAEQIDHFYPDLQDERFVSNFAIFHQRYSTNTFPTWHLAQPFRVLAHNGEINTLRGNVNWMAAHECRLESPAFGERIEDLKPIIQPDSSDSAALDAVAELLVRSERDLPTVKSMLIPEAWDPDSPIPQAYKDFYAYCNAVMEPWDGPAAICGYGGHWLVAGMDRNGLRPLRYTITKDALLFAGSETGMVRIDEDRVIEKGRLGPGQMLAVNLHEGRLYKDGEIKDYLAKRHAWASWVSRSEEKVAGPTCAKSQAKQSEMTREELRRRQLTYGITMEDMELILQPMVEQAKEAVGSMGDDTPLAVLSHNARPLHHFFRQNFSQVTNPPIDSLRERRVMTLRTRLGNLGNILDENDEQYRFLLLQSPVLTSGEAQTLETHLAGRVATIDCSFPIAEAAAGAPTLSEALTRIRREAEDAVRGGAEHVVLSDAAAGEERAPIPMILATGAVHAHLMRQRLRTFTAINVRSGECLDVHYFAVLIGIGATTVNAYLAEAAIADRHARGLFGQRSLAECLAAYKTAIGDGLLKIMSKMGISVISSYRGGANFEAIGLSRTLVDEYFPGVTSRISGIGLRGIQEDVLELHEKAWSSSVATLPVGGFYRYRKGGESHAWEAGLIHTLQQAVASDSYSTYQRFSKGLAAMPPAALRDLLGFKTKVGKETPLEEVESITSIRKRFVTPGMSLGALSPKAHGVLNIAMNRIGAKSDSGEGGEVPERYEPKPNGDNANSAIKQVASGRFGVTALYLNKCREIEIKVAQGAKPGEGGQLPGFKVTEMIGKLRHATPGVTLISPPPHHDIYSIEDLAQLIYDLKQINPDARVCVKLVARSGIGTIAAGVAKAKADVILISGHNGGTGASPQTSIKYAGVPWEMGLSEVHQVLTLNNLRHRIRLRTDGGIKTGRDVVIAAMLGAEEFGVGTASLVAMGCIMVRQCHSNTCPVGVCTQDEKLIDHFTGTPEKVVNLFSFLAEEVREILSSLGLRTLNEAIGRTDLLQQVSRGAAHLDDLDLNPLLITAEANGNAAYCTLTERNPVPDSLDAQILVDAAPLFDDGEKMQLQYNIQNTQRAIGTRLSAMITRRFGMTGLAPGHLSVRLRGSAGQSLGAWAVQGVKLEVFGDANDYVGKGLSGGSIVVRPPTKSALASQDNTIIGNTVLYGATAGELFAAGQAGERFCVRNSGAVAVVEGCGSNGCEYMTGGTTVILGRVGDNFAAGMTGGMAFIYDPEDDLMLRINQDSVIYQRVETQHYETLLRQLVEQHWRETQSTYAQRLLVDWHLSRAHFWQIVPKEMLARLDPPVTRELEEARRA